VGVVCKEEVRQGEYEDSWLFAVEASVSHPQPDKQMIVVTGERLSPTDLGERIPTLAGLAEKTVALVGLGGFGAPIAFELARAQLGELRVLDDDYVEAGTIVRWPLGVRAVGHAKVDLIDAWLTQEYPFTKVVPFRHRVGHVPAPDEPEGRFETEVLTEFFGSTSLVVDATAETGVQQLAAALADEARIPQVYAWGTEGGFGGMVARVVPGQTGCWRCLMLRIEDESIPAPPFAAGGTVQPRGCSAPTWTGSSFDALPTVAQAVRTICFTLLHGRVAGTRAPKDVFRLSQPLEVPGEVLAPQWDAYTLEPHPECGCSNGAGGNASSE
jgi:molybdopterin/thiamine biosynthesis adenylyltransferase